MELKKITKLSMLLALSIVLSLIESTIPIISNIIPGVKLGLANAVIIFVIYMYGFKEALFLSITRVLLIGIIRTGLFNIVFWFSLGGAILSLIAMHVFKETKLSVIGVSVVGAIFHSIGQIVVAIIVLSSFNIVYYLPYLLFFSIPTGVIIGMIAKEILKFYSSPKK